MASLQLIGRSSVARGTDPEGPGACPLQVPASRASPPFVIGGAHASGYDRRVSVLRGVAVALASRDKVAQPLTSRLEAGLHPRRLDRRVGFARPPLGNVDGA